MPRHRNRFARSAPVFCLALAATACGGGGGGRDSQTAAPDVALAGTIVAAGHTAVDSDLNDPAAPWRSNDDIGSAQVVTAPITLGGYVNLAGAGAAGASQQTGDPRDVFLMELRAGTQLALHVAGTPDADLDLYLLDADGEPVDAALDSGAVEVIDVPTDGSYHVVVQADRGAARYVLTAGAPAGAAAPDRLRLSARFVPGEMIARFDAPPRRTRHYPNPAQQAAAVGLRLAAGRTGEPLLLRMDRPGSQASAAGESHMSDQARAKLDTLRRIKALRRQDDVLYAEPNYLRRSLAAPDDPLYSRQWHYRLINLPLAWDLRNRDPGRAPLIAVVDTGVLRDHPDLRDILLDGYDFIRSPSAALDGDGIDPDPTDPGDEGEASSFHGTHVAGTAAAASNNGEGGAGVAWEARIMPLRVLGAGGGTSYDIQQALRYAAGLDNDAGRLPSRRADIINLSLGGPDWSHSERDLLRKLRELGVLVIAAAGNDATSAPFYPAAYEGVVGVSATGRYGELAPYSNVGSHVDVAAPGGDLGADLDGDGYTDGVLSASGRVWRKGTALNYRYFQGTSMATPHVSGVAALMKAIAPALTPAEFDALLAAGRLTSDPGIPGRDDSYGHGLIDAYRAVQAAHGLVTEPAADAAPVVSVEVRPAAVALGAAPSSGVIRVSSSEPATAVTAVDSSADWLAAAPTAVDAAGLGYYTLAIDRIRLPAGTHRATIRLTTSNGSVIVPVSVEVGAGAVGGDAGIHYVLLMDGVTGEPLAQQTATVVDGRYAFAFERLPAGSYYVIAGTDADNDGYICGRGEACAVQAASDAAAVVAVAHGRRELRLHTGFDPLLQRQDPVAGFRRLR